MIKQIKDHPLEGELLDAQIMSYGVKHAGAIKHKTKVIAWFVSNCNSKSGREEYVKELQKYISVSHKYLQILDIYFLEEGNRNICIC